MSVRNPCELGTALVKLGVAKGDHVSYRSLAGCVYPADVVNVRISGLIDLDVRIPGCSEPVRLTLIHTKVEA